MTVAGGHCCPTGAHEVVTRVCWLNGTVDQDSNFLSKAFISCISTFSSCSSDSNLFNKIVEYRLVCVEIQDIHITLSPFESSNWFFNLLHSILQLFYNCRYTMHQFERLNTMVAYRYAYLWAKMFIASNLQACPGFKSSNTFLKQTTLFFICLTWFLSSSSEKQVYLATKYAYYMWLTFCTPFKGDLCLKVFQCAKHSMEFMSPTIQMTSLIPF